MAGSVTSEPSLLTTIASARNGISSVLLDQGEKGGPVLLGPSSDIRAPRVAGEHLGENEMKIVVKQCALLLGAFPTALVS